MSRLLVVDDREENLYYLQALFSAHGYDVDTARHGAEALTKARRSPPDLVVSDLLMPVMDGYTLLRHWKADPLLRDIRFVVYTATYTEADDERLAIDLGADAFILKPAEPEDLLARIEAVQSDAAAPSALAVRMQVGDDDVLMQSYSRTLIRKLEEKTLQLEDSNRALLEDIAERQQAEAQLRLLNAAIVQSTEAVLITDAELDAPGPRIVFANPAFTRNTGYDVAEVVGRTPRMLQGPLTDRAVLRRMRSELAQGLPFSGETVNYRKDGSAFDHRWDVAPLQDGDGNVTHYVAVQRDVTQRNSDAEALLASNREQRLLAGQLERKRQRLVDAQRVAKVGSWETDLATGNVQWSEETCRIHGMPEDVEVTHALFLQLVHPDDRARVDAAFADSIARGNGGVIQHRLLLADGCLRHVEQRWRIDFDADGAPLRALGTCQDVDERVQAESTLRNTRDRLLLATQSAGIGIWDWDIVANQLVGDAQMRRLYGLQDGEFHAVYEAWTDQPHPDDRERVQAAIASAVAGEADYAVRFRIVRADGEVHDIEAHGLVQRAADGTALRMIGANRDITDQMQAERRIRYLNRVHAMTSSVNALIVRATTREALFAQACRIAVDPGGFQLAMIGIVVPEGLDFIAIAGASDDTVDAVRGFMATRGATPSAMAARAMRDGVAAVSNASQSDPRVDSRELHVRFGNHSLAILPLLVSGVAVGVIALYAAEPEFFHDEELALLTELAGDVALAVDHLDNAERLAFLSYYDALTGLANRSLFLERVGQYARSAAGAGEPLAVVIVDLERFRNINDSLGRDAGDEVLRQVAGWLGRHLGDANLLARLDADHFGIVLPAGGGRGDVAHVVERMMTAFLGQSFEVGGNILRIAARAGIAVHPTDGDDAEGLFKRAEAALKNAAASGARYRFYAQEMGDAVAGRLALESQLRSALENREFVLHYQPKVDLRSGRLSGAEALIRWNQPGAGLMPPALFIPILEETGMINEVGQWALQQATADWLRWRAAGLPAVPIAVNVSPLQLRDPAFITQLAEVVAVAEGAARGLTLEITESMVMADVKQSIATLRAIRDMGIQVVIDDFGTGFSSLGYLGKLPIDALKIDRMFIMDMGASAEGIGMVSTMLTLAHSLKLGMVAEGVETAEQAAQLRLLDCDEIQGYLVSPPLPCEAFEARFLSGDWRIP